jgi:DNA-binding response OmpR family regulator
MGSRATNMVRRLLLVDDEPDITSSLKIGLESHGLIVDTFNDPVKVLTKFKANEYDAAILDIRMPQISGFELYRQIRRIDPEMPIYFLTAFDLYPSEFEKIFPELRPQALFRKPVTISSLLLVTA